MRFRAEEIKLAKQLRHQGLVWEPKAGHYVYDNTGFCKQPSPFQEKVYFVLNYDYFMKTVGGVARFKEIMTWLPTWEDAREILSLLGASDQQVATELSREQAIEHRSERLVLYQLIASLLDGDAC